MCSCLEFVPTNKTVRLLQNSGLLVRKSARGLMIAYDRSSQESLQLHLTHDVEGLDMVFKVYARDPQFKSYTEPFFEQQSGMLYFTNQSSPAADDGVVRLHKARTVSNKDIVSMESAQLVDMLDRRDRLIPPVFVIRIQADEKFNHLFDEKLSAKTPRFQVKFAARQTYWKYFLQSDKASDDVFVFDPDGRIEFESSSPDRLADGRSVSTYRSKQRIPLNERFDFRFQLKQRRNGVEKVLFRQLPYARVNQTGKEVVAEQAIAVSEIYINY
jgi:hypothetical protein